MAFSIGPYASKYVGIVTGVMDGGTVTVRAVQNQYHVSLNTARADIRHLSEIGLLTETGRKVNMKVYAWSGKEI